MDQNCEFTCDPDVSHDVLDCDFVFDKEVFQDVLNEV